MTVPATNLDPDSLKYMLSMPHGRVVIWDMLAAFGLFRSPFEGETSLKDFRLGMHNAALIIYADCMAVSPDLTALMIREQGDYDNAAGTDTKPKPSAEPRSDSITDPDANSLGFGRTGSPGGTALGGD